MTTGLTGDLAGKIVLVTGGSQGVGGAAAQRAAEWGASGVVICRAFESHSANSSSERRVESW